MKKITLFLFLSTLFQFGFAQDCYDSFLKKGIEAYNDLDFEVAVNQFKAAKICDDIPSDNQIVEWVDKAQTGYVDAIKRERTRARSLTLTTKSILELQNNKDATKAFKYAQYALEMEDNEESRRAFYNSYYQLAEKDRKNFYVSASQIPEDKYDSSYFVWATFIDQGKTVLIKDDDDKILFFDFSGKEIAKQLQGLEGEWPQIYSDSSKLLLSILEGDLVVHTFKNGTLNDQPKFKYHSDKGDVSGMAISNNGEKIALSFGNKNVHILNKEGTFLYDIEKEGDASCEFMSFSDNNELTIVYNDEVKFIHLDDKTYQTIQENKNFKPFGNSIQISPNGQFIMMVSDGYEGLVLNIAGDTIVSHYDSDHIGQSGTFSSDNILVLLGNEIFDLENGNQEYLIESDQESFVASSDLNYIIGRSEYKTDEVDAWTYAGKDNDYSDFYNEYGKLGHANNKINSLFFSSYNPNHLISFSKDQSFKIWDLQPNGCSIFFGQGDKVRPIEINGEQYFYEYYSSNLVLWKMEGTKVNTMRLKLPASSVISPKGKYLFVKGTNEIKILNLLDFKTGETELNMTLDERSGLWATVFSDDDKVVYSYKKGDKIQAEILDIPTKKVYPLNGISKNLSVIKWSTNNQRLAVCTEDGDVLVWDISQGLDQIKLEANVQLDFDWDEYGFEFTPDANSLLVSSDMESFLWKIGDPEDEITPVRFNKEYSVIRATYSPDGAFLLTVCNDYAARVFTKAGDLIVELKDKNFNIETAVFSKDGRYIITNNLDHDLRIWPFDSSIITTYLLGLGLPDLSEKDKVKYGILDAVKQKNLQANKSKH